MAKIIPVSFRRSRLPRILLRDGWWLESPPSRPSVIAFPKRTASNPSSDAKSQTEPKTKPKPKTRHLTLVHSGK
jgi:hypothetical protein